jgi:hypothetical protein
MLSCGGGLQNCGGVCRDLSSDRAHCGACGRACGPGQICAGGACSLSCPPGQVACGTECVDGTSNSCGAPIDLGTLVAGSSTGTEPRRIPAAGQQEWFVVRFPQSFDTREHGTGAPTITFGLNEGGVFQIAVYASCGAGADCGRNLPSWSFRDSCSPLTSCLTRNAAWPNTAYIRVTRTSGGTDCRRYQLALSR